MLYNLYNKFMNNNYDILTDGTNFSISNGIYDIIISDCFYFGYIKNNKPNISGFINHIIPHLAKYREDLHLQFLKNNNYDEDIARLIECNIYNIYLKTFDISNDSKRKIQLRINKENESSFREILYKHLNKYNLDFTNYIRTLLLDYSIKPLYQREYFSIYSLSKKIEYAIQHCKEIVIKTRSESINLIPITYEVNSTTAQSFLFGFASSSKDVITILEYSKIQNIIVLDNSHTLTQEDYNFIIDSIQKFFNDLNTSNNGE